MIIKKADLPEQNGRTGYPITGHQKLLQHLAVRITTPDNPFKPHRHEAEELWYIVDGKAWVSLNGEEQIVVAGDVIILEPWVEHGLRTEGQVKWVCVG